MNDKELEETIHFIYEIGNLRKTPRSGFWLLGTGEQTVAEHLYRTAMIVYALAHFTPKANKERCIFIALSHDIAEGRTSDLNYVHQRYGRLAEMTAFEDLAQTLPFGPELRDAFLEEQKRETLEAKLVKDADILEWMASLRDEEFKGNSKAKEWIIIAQKRLKTPIGKKFGKRLMATNPDAWWFNKSDKWFVGRNEKDRSMVKKVKKGRRARGK